MLIVAGTGIVADYLCGPLGWPYDIFKLATLAAMCRVKLVFLSVGVGPIRHPLSRWFLKRSLALAQHRSYRDAASKQYLEKIGFNTDRDFVCPDLVFGLSPDNPPAGVRTGRRPVVGLGLKDYASTERGEAFREYLETMAAFVSWLHGQGYGVRLLIGDIQYDSWVIEEFVDVLKKRSLPTHAPLLIAQPALTVKELLRQVDETEAVISARYHNLVVALIQDKPIIALSDHAKLDSLATDFGLADYLIPVANLSSDVLIAKFKQLQNDVERLRPYIRAELHRYRQALDELYATLLAQASAPPPTAGLLPRLQQMSLKSPIGLYLRINQGVWKGLPAALRDTRAARWYGGILHKLVCRRANRQQFFGTFFLRNRPELELIRRLIQSRPQCSMLRICVLGCSTGAEVYSLLWTIRSARPDLKLQTSALDISPEILRVAQAAVYTSESSQHIGRSIFERLSDDELQAIFDWEGDKGTVKPWIRSGITWHLGDATDPELVRVLGPQDIVLANNFLCHMPPARAEKCLRNIARLVDHGGHLFAVGVDLAVRSKVACELGWQPVLDLIREIHDGDPSVRGDWPWQWWGLEPLNDKRRGWQLRYAVAYRNPSVWRESSGHY
jgi:polysaccharide pyruvyl transferase WcaK-like protein/SAM-dependent methyltransferase